LPGKRKSGRGSAFGVFAGGNVFSWICAIVGLASAKIKAKAARVVVFGAMAPKGAKWSYHGTSLSDHAGILVPVLGN
jgi:hypothetical protein